MQDQSGNRIRIHASGAHAQRMPLRYPALAGLVAGFADMVQAPHEADLYVFAHSLDIQAAGQGLVEDWRARRRPVVLLSEEPFWDTIWARRPLSRRRVLDTRWGALPVIQLNHHTSTIFDFDHIPYYLLTNHRFAAAYGAHFTRNAQMSPAAWRAAFAARRTDVAFMFERRPEPFHAMAWPDGDIFGLCSWRTELAEACTGDGVDRLGSSWRGGPTRFELMNWHLDKLVRLDGRARVLSGIENTHQPNYITEKFFDAFACGALPLYVAGPGHRVHEFALPGRSWLNLHGMTPAQAADRIGELQWDSALFEAYAGAQQRLAALFCDTGLWVDERRRLAGALRRELVQVLDGG